MLGERYLIASDVILAYPELIGASVLGAELLMAKRSFESLEQFAGFGFVPSAYVDLLKEAVAGGSLRLIATSADQVYNQLRSFEPSQLDFGVDDTLVRLALEHRATLATDDQGHSKLAVSHGVAIVSGATLRRRVTAPPPSEKLAAILTHFVSTVRREAFLSVITAVAIVYGAASLFAAAPRLLNALRPWSVAILVAIGGLWLFILRLKLRLAYGLAEVAVGIVTGWNVASPNRNQVSLPAALQVLAALYIIVRGIDNLVTGWRESPLRVWWRRFVGEHRPAQL
jgi:hypothetical protein